MSNKSHDLHANDTAILSIKDFYEEFFKGLKRELEETQKNINNNQQKLDDAIVKVKELEKSALQEMNSIIENMNTIVCPFCVSIVLDKTELSNLVKKIISINSIGFENLLKNIPVENIRCVVECENCGVIRIAELPIFQSNENLWEKQDENLPSFVSQIFNKFPFVKKVVFDVDSEAWFLSTNENSFWKLTNGVKENFTKKTNILE